MLNLKEVCHGNPSITFGIDLLILYTCISHIIGAFYYILGNMNPSLQSNLSNIQLLLFAKHSSVPEYGIDRILEPIVEDIKKN